MNTKDLIEKLQKMPPDAIVFLSDNNIEILGIQYEYGKVQILMDDTCPNCYNLETEIASKDEYMDELREEQTELKNQITKLESKISQIHDIID